MTLEVFKSTLVHKEPAPELPGTLKALWYDAKENWEKAHDIAQEIDTPEGSRIHAYLHRKEGDLGNAGYWYRRAGKEMPGNSTLEEEWEQLVKLMLNA